MSDGFLLALFTFLFRGEKGAKYLPSIANGYFNAYGNAARKGGLDYVVSACDPRIWNGKRNAEGSRSILEITSTRVPVAARGHMIPRA